MRQRDKGPEVRRSQQRIYLQSLNIKFPNCMILIRTNTWHNIWCTIDHHWPLPQCCVTAFTSGWVVNSSGKVGVETPVLRVRTCVAWNNIGVLHFKNINSKTVVSCEVYNVNSIGKVGIWHWNTSCQGSYLHCLDSRNVKMPECHNENIYWR